MSLCAKYVITQTRTGKEDDRMTIVYIVMALIVLLAVGFVLAAWLIVRTIREESQK